MSIAGENKEVDEILYTLCWHNVSIMGGWCPFPATAIAKTLDMSVHKVRYHLRKLKQQGIVDSISEGGMTISEFFKEKYSVRKDKENIYGVGMSDTEFRHFIIQYLLPENWYVVDPIGQSQVNEVAINEILTKYSKKFRRENKKFLKELRGGENE